MRTILITIALALFFAGCDSKKTSNATQQPQGQELDAKAQINEVQNNNLEFPYYAVISCGSNFNANFPAWQCFSGSNNVNTELEIRNGSDYKMYTFSEMMMMPLDDGKLVINLRKKFQLNMQNASDSFILNLKIHDAINQEIRFEKSASLFGTITISN